MNRTDLTEAVEYVESLSTHDTAEVAMLVGSGGSAFHAGETKILLMKLKKRARRDLDVLPAGQTRKRYHEDGYSIEHGGLGAMTNERRWEVLKAMDVIGTVWVPRDRVLQALHAFGFRIVDGPFSSSLGSGDNAYEIAHS